MPDHSLLDEEPTVEEVREFYEHVQTDPGIQRQRTLDTLLENLYFGEHLIVTEDTDAPDRKRRIKVERLETREAARTIDLIRSFFITWPRWGTQFTGEGHRPQLEGEQVAFALNEAFDQLNPATDSPWKDGVWDQCLFGRRVDLIIPGDRYFWDFPWLRQGEREKDWHKRAAEWRRKSPLPVTWMSLPAKSTFPASLSTVDDAVLCTKTLNWQELIDVFGDDELAAAEVPVPKKGAERHQELTLGIFANRAYIAYVYLAEKRGLMDTIRGREFPDKMIRVQPHGLNKTCIRILPGMTTGKKEFGFWWQSVIFNVRDMIQQADRLGTRTATSAKFDTYPLLKHWTNAARDSEEEDGSRSGIVETDEGDILALDGGDPTTGRPREDIQAIFQPQHGEQTRELFLFTLQRIAQITGAVEALEGNIPHAGTPAWALNWSSEMAKFKLRPLTDAVMAAGRDIAETLSAAVISFGEPIPLAKLDDEGQRVGTISLKPDTLKKFSVVISGTYDAQVPQNENARVELMMSLIERARKEGFPSPIWIAEKFGGIHDFYRQLQEATEVWFLMSEEFRNAQAKFLANEFETDMESDAGMSVEELLAVQGQIPPQLFEKLMQVAGQSQGQQGQNGARGGVSNATRGALRAGNPFERPAGNQPTVLPVPGSVP